ncbi:MAG: glutathione-disulfide reductase [Pseudomonadota bacterium]
MSTYDYDYFVIGAGSGGVRSARIAAGHGAKVGIAEGASLGGTCVNLGCVPKKLFAYASDFGPAFEDAKNYGWSAENILHDWTTLRDNKTKEIERLNHIYEGLLERAGVTLYPHHASFIDEHTLQVGEDTITANKILIATGGKPRKPEFPGAEHAIVSDDAFYLDDLPKRILIQGGGYISVEFAHIFHGLGVHVDLIYRDTIFLRGFDSDLRDFLAAEMNKQGCALHFSCDIDEIVKQDDGSFNVICNDGNEIETDLIFSAIGRLANTDNLGLENINPDMTSCGRILTNEHYQTSLPHIYAVGDVTNFYALTPVAIAEGHALADNLFGNQDRAINYDNIATAIFSHPPIGTVGLSEEKAKERGHKVDIYKTSFKPMVHTISKRDEKILMKLVVDQDTDKVLGVHMCGVDAPEIIQPMSLALNLGATKADFDRTMPVHPTAAEEFMTMREKFES